ncbi:MAG: TetR/AcrR family transcriptional regulator [Pseudomonadota bacterium]
MTTSPTFRNLDQAKQDRILDEALSEFAAKGYGQASLNVLVARLGIAKGSIFQYFRDKAGLFRLVFDFAVGQVKGHLRQVRGATQGQDVFRRLEESLVAGLELIQQKPRLLRLYLRIVYEGDVPLRGQLLQSIRLFSREYILELLAEGQARGELRPDLDPELAAFVVDAVLERFLVARSLEYLDAGLGLHGAEPAEARRLAGQLVDVLRRGLGAD